jgi:predicted transcriptional regulator
MGELQEKKDFETEWIFAEYEAGRTVSEIAAELGKSESYVYARMRRRPKKYEDVKRIREEEHHHRICRIRGLADKLVLDYLEKLAAENTEAGEEIDRVNRIAKDYAHRVQLDEGRATENVGVGQMPFTMIVRKTYPDRETAEAACDD